jgi:hypothetical protein
MMNQKIDEHRAYVRKHGDGVQEIRPLKAFYAGSQVMAMSGHGEISP